MRHALYISGYLSGLVWAVLAGAGPARADEPPAPGPAEAPGFWERDALTGDWGGARTRLADWGVALGAVYSGEMMANVSGGLRRGAVYTGQLKVSADLDLARLASWDGATIHADAFQIHGRGLTAEFLGNLLVTSNIEAHTATRLYTAWFQQNLFDDRVSIRAGQIAADDEFVISDTALAFLNGTFAWLPHTASNLPGGGPGYPLATPGARIAVMPADDLTVLTAVFSGDPAGKPGAEDPQIHNDSGTTFSLDGGALLMAEIQYALNRGGEGLPGTYKVGGWYHTGKFDDLRTDNTGLSLADPATSGVPVRHRGNHGIYAVADQMVYREEGGEDRGLNLFLRLGGAPSDRNLIEFYVDGGLGYKGLIPGRQEDVLAVGGGFAELSHDLQRLDNDSRAFSGANTPVRSHEAVLEFTYIGRIAPWWSVQPDVQLLFNPGGNIANPNDSSGLAVIPDAVVVGLRTVVAF